MALFNRFVNRRGASSLVLSAGLLALVGCTNPIDQRGNLPEPDKLSLIKAGSTDKATVTQLLGSPSSIAAFDSETWYYISQKTRPVAFFKPELVDQEVVAIDFDKDGVVSDLRHRSMDDGEAIQPNPNATPAPGREFSLLEQLIGNFGKFNNKDKGSATTSGH